MGSVTITVPSPSAQSLEACTVSIALTRAVGFKTQRPSSTEKNELLIQKILRQRSIRKRSSASHEPAVCANVETITQCNLWHAPEKIEHNHEHDTTEMHFAFAIPIPHNLPATTDTILSKLSYAIKATARSASGRSIETIRPIRIQRCLVPQHIETTHHSRNFAGEDFATELRITPRESVDQDIKTAYSAELVAYGTIMDGVRKTEVKHAVIKELKWMVEETVKGPCPSSQEEECCQSQHIRQLCEGKRKGNWKTTGHSPGMTEKGDRIKIPFDVSIPRSAGATDELEPCEEAAGLTVNHRLRLDIVTGEDTFDQATGRLVDRRPRKKSFVSFFALPVLEFASREDATSGSFSVSNLPNYTDSVKPPNYEVME
ncbi:Endocytosis regulator [Aspergillus melleus]|uniref:Endocytosis regulator n=1 Tax=Aspergillus melleus TaxID=138277 RepID=A0ACC3AU73_9EURO|nr:Endocytosis regulator [Aspergillus melleus]